jgi:hypothetical protein
MAMGITGIGLALDLLHAGRYSDNACGGEHYPTQM